MNNQRNMRRHALVGLGLLALVTACSPGGAKGTQENSGDPAAAATHVGARAALTGFDCQPDNKGNWSAKGTVNNDDGSKATFVVRISVAGKDSHVVASATKQVTVDASGAAQLEAADFGKASGKGLNCSAHVTRAIS